ncbi:MAG: ATP-binding protein [Sulfuricurvum sp.]|nr:ATP-binding protein [Sulfuricurvum sp.]
MVDGVFPQSLKEQLKYRLKEHNPEYRYYKSIFNLTRDLIALSDGDRIIDANRAFISFFEEQGINVFAPDFLFPAYLTRIDKFGYVYDGYQEKRWYETILSGGKELYRVAIAGAETLHTFNITLSQIAPDEETYILTLTDITEMMGYKSVLEESFRSSVEDKKEAQFLFQQYDRAIDVSNLVSKSDLDGTLTYVNDAFCKALKYEREELIGDNVLILCVPDENDLCYEAIWKIIKDGHIWKGVIQNMDKEGEIHYFDTTIVPIKDPSGEVREYLSVRHEITEMVKAKEEAIRTLESKTKFFDQVSHELRTPLNAIVNFTDLALENFEDLDEESRDLAKMYIERAYKNSQSLLSLINSLLDMAKLKSGQETFAIEAYNASELVMETYENCSSLNNNNDVEYRLNVQLNTIWINCDPLKFRQILTNLISNALKFTQRGFVEVRIATVDDNVLIEVEDTGMGIAHDKLHSVFEPFQQARNDDLGTGLGLSIVREYAHAMGFVLDVRSSEGIGSCFTLKTKRNLMKEELAWVI